jgi:uracil-DNA glycosylase family 4
VGLAALEDEITHCRRCPRLVAWREEVARVKRAAFASETYWGRPIPGFGDPGARVVVLGLAPAAHGGNRTGRVFTGDRSADFLYASLHRTGFANQPVSVSRDDGLRVTGAWVTAAVRCAPPENKPTPQERDRCISTWMVPELRLLENVRVVVCLGAFAWDAALRVRAAMPGGDPLPRPKPRFGHAVELEGRPWTLLGCFHPSPHNTVTGVLTPPMMDAALERARALATAPEVRAGARRRA